MTETSDPNPGALIRPRGLRKTQQPCLGCGLHAERCICKWIPSLSLKTKVSLVIHHRELKRTTNTGTLALRALVNSDCHVRGLPEKPFALESILEDQYENLLLYPADDAVELTTEFCFGMRRPVHLIGPDGNWRQASKVHYRHLQLKTLKRVRLKSPEKNRALLRTETKPDGMSTLQAIAEALGVLEGATTRDQLLALYERKLEQTLQGRGQCRV